MSTCKSQVYPQRRPPGRRVAHVRKWIVAITPCCLYCAVVVAVAARSATAADAPVFSGPQPGEPLVPFVMNGVLGDAGREIDLVSSANGKPMVIIFFHERTRPAFALTRTVARMAASRRPDGLSAGVCFLADDPTETESWIARIPQYFPAGITFGISPDGREGPGAYGLNRNVALTVLVANQNRVTANFALVQPSLQADGPKIFKAVVDALGGGPVPDLADFVEPRRTQRPPR